jgi:hypothetical protein
VFRAQLISKSETKDQDQPIAIDFLEVNGERKGSYIEDKDPEIRTMPFQPRGKGDSRIARENRQYVSLSIVSGKLSR